MAILQSLRLRQKIQKWAILRLKFKFQEKGEMRVNKSRWVFPRKKKLENNTKLTRNVRFLKETKNVISEFLERVKSISYRKKDFPEDII